MKVLRHPVEIAKRDVYELTSLIETALQNNTVVVGIQAPPTKNNISSRITVYYPFNPLHGLDLEVTNRP